MPTTRDNLKNEAQNLNIRSEQVQDILGRPPRWMIRWGITVIFFLLLVLITGSWFFRYPEVITANVVVTTENPPAMVVSRTTGEIEHLFVENQQRVEKGDSLAVIESTAHYRDVLKLEKEIKTFSKKLRNEKQQFYLSEQQYKLGEVQSSYAAFVKNLEDYNHFLALNYHQQKINMLKKEEVRYRQHYQKLMQQREIAHKEFKLAQNQYLRDSTLYEREVIPQAELERSQTELLRKHYALEQTEISLSNARIQLSQIEENMLELELQHENRLNQLEILLLEAYDNLMANIDSWKRNYYLESPIDGIVTFTKYWSENQYIQAGKRVMTVIPAKEGEIIGKITMAFQGAGKVNEGQQVNISFANYPAMEYGMVKGIVRSISLVPEEGVYTVEVSLPNGLTTFYGEKLEFSHEMQGKAEIITDDTRLLERIIRPIRFMVKKSLN